MPILLHKEIMLLIQIITGNIQTFAKSLEVNDFPFSQKAKRSQYGGVFRQIDQVFIGAFCFLFNGYIFILLDA